MDYQKTLNLPQTDFSMRAGLAQKEPLLLKEWEDKALYRALRQKAEGQKSYILHDGPPYANGRIHLGHALNKVLKDMIVKMKTMQGMDALYVPGWDCHGLPIEHQLFKELKKTKTEVNVLDFRSQAKDYALKYVDIQREEFKRLGIFGEWDRPYLTLTPEYEYWILHCFSRLAKAGYIYRGLKPVNWCASCETALAEAEVEYEDHSSPSVYVRFKVLNPEKVAGLPKDKPLSLLIWTTTPWTLLANVAVAVHLNFSYSFVDTGKEVLVMESSLRDQVLGKAGLTTAKVIKELKGSALQELVYAHPFQLKDRCRVVGVDYVTKEDGTGLVHTAPGHGQEDYETGIAFQLDILMPVNDRGVFTAEAGAFAGQHVFKANENIIRDLSGRGMLFAEEKIAHSYPHCWRCKKPIIFRATKQWFLKIDHNDLRAKLNREIEKVQWVPEAGRERISGMVALRPDWCLSRQRLWGVPIPALACQGCGGEHKLYPEVIDRLAEAVKKAGTDTWFERDAADFVPPGFRCPDCGKGDFTKTYEILDVWFDSGVSHQAVIGPMMKKPLPADLYLEGSDQHRGWFQSSLIPSVALDGKAPYRAVLTHGFTVDGQGRKMSKSLGNVIAPQDIIKNNGVDILRLWVASSNYSDDIRLSPEILDRLIDAYRKIRNTFRYLLGNLNGFRPDQDQVAYQQLLDIDRWALHRLAVLLESLRQAYEAFEFSKVYKLIYGFCNDDLSSFYLDILKDRLYTSHTSSTERRAAQTVLYQITDHLVRMLAPILVFTAEEIFQAMPRDPELAKMPSVHLLDWLTPPGEWKNPDIEQKFALLMELRPFVLKAMEEKRQTGMIGSPLEAKVILRTASDRDEQYLKGFGETLASLFVVSQAEIARVDQVTAGLSEMFPKTDIGIERAAGEKCPRCWNYRVLGKVPDAPDLCERCAGVVKRIMVSS